MFPFRAALLSSVYSAGAAAASIVTKSFATSTASGNDDITSAALGSQTPKAALLVGTGHLVANDPSGTPTAVVGVSSICSGSRTFYSRSISGQTSTAVQRRASTTDAIYLSNGAASRNATGSLISGGIRLGYTGTVANQFACGYMAFAGDNVQAADGLISLGTGTSAIDVNTVGFQPDVVILFAPNDDWSDSTSSAHGVSFGFATSDGTQRCMIWGESDGVSAARPVQAILTDCGGGQMNATNGTVAYKLVVSDFDSSGFSVTPSASTGSDKIAYLALKFTGGSVKIRDFTTPTSTGVSSITGTGFTPTAAIMVLTNLEAVDFAAGGTSALQTGLNISLLGNETWAGAWRINSPADPTSTSSYRKSTALYCQNGAESARNEATASFKSDGLDLTYSAVQTNGKKGFGLFFG